MIPIAAFDRCDPVSDESLKPQRVDRVDVRFELIARRPGGDLASAGQGLERLPQLGDVDLHRVGRRSRWSISPEQVDQAVDRDDLADMHEQDREDRSLLGRPEFRRRTVCACLQRTEDAKLHRLPLTSLLP